MFQPKCSSQIKKMGYYLAINKNETMPFAATGMNLEIILLNEESQKEKIFYDIIYKWNLKRSTNELIYKIETKPQTKESNLWFAKVWGGKNWEFGIHRCTLPYIK